MLHTFLFKYVLCISFVLAINADNEALGKRLFRRNLYSYTVICSYRDIVSDIMHIVSRDIKEVVTYEITRFIKRCLYELNNEYLSSFALM